MITVLPALLALGLAAAYGMTAAPELSDALLERYIALQEAEVHHDAPAIAAILADDFTLGTLEGTTQTRDEFLAAQQNAKWDSRATATFSVNGIESDGRIASVVAVETVTTGSRARGDAHDTAIVSRTEDVWIYVSGTWLLERQIVRSLDIAKDGKIVTRLKRA